MKIRLQILLSLFSLCVHGQVKITTIDAKFKGTPHCFVVNDNGISIGDGESIYFYDARGKFLEKKNISKSIHGEKFFEFAMTSDKEFVYVKSPARIYKLNNKNVKLADSCKKGGEVLKLDKNENLYFLKQEASSYYGNGAYNLVYSFNSCKNIFSNDTDMAALNYEIINDTIFMHTGNGVFVMRPIDPAKPSFRTPLSIEEGTNISFLGMSNNRFFFRFFDDMQKKDVICIYNRNLKLEKRQVIDLPISDISGSFWKNEGFDFDFPSGNIYTYYNGSIYFMRNTKSGICFYRL